MLVLSAVALNTRFFSSPLSLIFLLFPHPAVFSCLPLFSSFFPQFPLLHLVLFAFSCLLCFLHNNTHMTEWRLQTSNQFTTWAEDVQTIGATMSVFGLILCSIGASWLKLNTEKSQTLPEFSLCALCFFSGSVHSLPLLLSNYYVL